MRRSPAYGLLVRCLSPLPQCALRGVSTIAAAAALDVQLSTQRDRKTKIVCTIGPATVDRIPDLILAGMDVARINCAHGSPSSYATIVNNVRLATDRIRQEGIRPTDVERADCASVAIAFDIKGPEIRTGQFNDTVPTNKIASTDAKGVISYAIGNKEIMVKAGDTLTLTCNPELAAAGTPGLVYINYAHLAAQARPGQLVYIDDGNVELVVTSVDAAHSSLTAISRTTAPLGERKGVNLPGLLVDLPHVTKKDEADIALARSLGADFLFASFVQSAEMVDAIRRVAGPGLRIISKIENEAGLANYDSILDASDGIMVARGDLGVQLPPERVFLAQKRMVARANIAGKPVICATQMLESMTHSQRPTRAECTDVATAVNDGCDAVMLSGETAKGMYPLEATAMMSKICGVAESAFGHWSFFIALSELLSDARRRRRGRGAAALALSSSAATSAALPSPTSSSSGSRALLLSSAFGGNGNGSTAAPLVPDRLSDQETLAAAAVHASFDVGASLIVVISRTGRTAGFLAKYRPSAPIIAIAYDEATCRRVQLLRGVQGIRFDEVGVSVHDVINHGVAIGRSMGLAVPGDTVVVVCGVGVGVVSGSAPTQMSSSSSSSSSGASSARNMQVSLLHVES